MATPSSYPTTKDTPPVEYPTGDGQPMAETPIHRDNMIAMLDVLKARYATDPMVYISGDMFLYYVPGKKRRHVSPDVFLVRDIPNKDRDAYFVWEEGKGPDVVFEFTSKSTRNEDLDDKYNLYQDTLGVFEYFLFDPKQEYLTPSLQGFRLRSGRYVPIEPVEGRLPSEVLGLHLEREGAFLRPARPGHRPEAADFVGVPQRHGSCPSKGRSGKTPGRPEATADGQGFERGESGAVGCPSQSRTNPA